jgi:hypothetical protein
MKTPKDYKTQEFELRNYIWLRTYFPSAVPSPTPYCTHGHANTHILSRGITAEVSPTGSTVTCRDHRPFTLSSKPNVASPWSRGTENTLLLL